MKILFSSIALLFLNAAISQVNTETRTVSDFTGIKTSSVVPIEITQGEVNAVVVEGDAKNIADVKTEVNDGILSVSGSPNAAEDFIVKVTMKNLRMLDVSGAASIKSANQLKIDSLKIIGSGASNVKLDVQAGKIKAILAGASTLKLSGTASKLDAQLAGASHLKAYQLTAENVELVTAGASSANISPTVSMNVISAGASEVHYQGNPAEKNINKAGASKVIAKDAGQHQSDTTSIHMGKYDVHVTENDDDDERSNREKKADNSDFEFWQGIDFGVNGFLTADNKIELPAGFEFLELNYAKSYFFSWNFFQKNIHIYRNNINLGTGLGMSWYHYNFRNSYSLTPNVEYATATYDSLRYSKNRLGITYLNVPLFLEFNTNNKDAGNSFHIAGGMEFGYNVFNNQLKQKYELDGHKYKRKEKDDFNVNPFRYDIIGRIGYGDFTIFGKYSLSTLFEKDKGPVVYPFTAGINLSF